MNCPYTPLSRDSGWPLTGNILDPVRCSVVVENASQILQILSWLEDTDCGVTVCKVKNRYSEYAEVLDGYRDMVVTVLFTDSSNGLSIIGVLQGAVCCSVLPSVALCLCSVLQGAHGYRDLLVTVMFTDLSNSLESIGVRTHTHTHTHTHIYIHTHAHTHAHGY